jgi:hypothetical protein
MRSDIKDHSVNDASTQLQRLALRAAMIGFCISLGIMILYMAMLRQGASAGEMRTSLEAICVVLWPSAILMLGARTYHGGTVLFLLSACLNAGYFVLAVMMVVAVFHSFNFISSASKTSAVTEQQSGGPLLESLHREGPIA